MINAILALALTSIMNTTAPMLMQPYENPTECLERAAHLNLTDENLKAKDAQEAGAKYVCLIVVVPQNRQ